MKALITSTTHTTVKKLAVLIAVLQMTGACAGLSFTSTAPSSALYMLNAAQAHEGSSISAKQTLVVERPKMAPGLDTDRIALTHDRKRRLDYYATGHWVDTLPELFHAFLKDSLHKRIALRHDRQNIEKDERRYRLQTDVLEFQAQYNKNPVGTPDISVRIRYMLEDAATGSVISSGEKSELMEVEGKTLEAVTSALQKAARRIVSDISEVIVGIQ